MMPQTINFAKDMPVPVTGTGMHVRTFLLACGVHRLSVIVETGSYWGLGYFLSTSVNL